MNIWALSFTTFSDAPLALSLYCPLILTMLCASQALWWLKIGAGVPAVEDAELALVRTGRFSGLITLALCAWALAVFAHVDAYGQSHVMFFMAITIIGSVSCLTHLLPAAIVVGLARRQGHLGGGKLNAHGEWVRERLAQNGDLTLDELCLELAGRGVIVHRSNVGRLLHRLDLSHKKKPAGK
ncbi:hypothetical protein [Sinorhizobium fredii]|uniref:hypothetical protein n=1 Tax=Rhizobium fredii TaxID=380 RepID=UPI001F0A6BBC|nr:hypothetical protein [Sinorhizobium fredii]